MYTSNIRHQANHLDTSSGLATRSDTKKKKEAKERVAITTSSDGNGSGS